jgi:hypothetical protein
MARVTGRRVPLSLPRTWIADLMHACRGLPLVMAERRLRLGPLVGARGRCPDPPPWAAILVKGYALVAARTPALRRSYQSYPWPHLFEADDSVASVAVARDYHGEPAVFFGLIHGPDRQPLRLLAAHLDEWKTKPVESIRPFARLVRYSRYPRPARRLVWWLGLNLSGRHRAKTVGTFGLSTVAGLGASIPQILAPTATTLNYGPFEESELVVRLTFDHRVLDGGTAATALADLEQTLNNDLVRELESPRKPTLS